MSGEFASKVNSDGARINAVIDPEGGPTTFHIEYGTDPSYGSVAPIPDVRVLGYLTEAQAVSADIGGLTPETEYHYRVVATNGAGSGVQRRRPHLHDVSQRRDPRRGLSEPPGAPADRRRPPSRLPGL